MQLLGENYEDRVSISDFAEEYIWHEKKKYADLEKLKMDWEKTQNACQSIKSQYELEKSNEVTLSTGIMKGSKLCVYAHEARELNLFEEELTDTSSYQPYVQLSFEN